MTKRGTGDEGAAIDLLAEADSASARAAFVDWRLIAALLSAAEAASDDRVRRTLLSDALRAAGENSSARALVARKESALFPVSAAE